MRTFLYFHFCLHICVFSCSYLACTLSELWIFQRVLTHAEEMCCLWSVCAFLGLWLSIETCACVRVYASHAFLAACLPSHTLVYEHVHVLICVCACVRVHAGAAPHPRKRMWYVRGVTMPSFVSGICGPSTWSGSSFHTRNRSLQLRFRGMDRL